jgi:prepilin-type N-terminal cleavage/methylation domain-containing protein
MKKNGFTLVEILAVLIILGVLVVLTIPAYTSVYNTLKRENLKGKITQVQTAAKKYGETIKDEIQDTKEMCYTTTIAQLIRDGYLASDVEKEPALINPTDNSKLTGDVKICYCTAKYDIEAYYTSTLDPHQSYYEDDVIVHNNKIYECVSNYVPRPKPKTVNNLLTEHFREVSC